MIYRQLGYEHVLLTLPFPDEPEVVTSLYFSLFPWSKMGQLPTSGLPFLDSIDGMITIPSLVRC